MKADTVYAPSDCCDTLPCPQPTERITTSGGELDAFRRSVMEMRGVGLTKLYDLVSDETITTSDFIHLREIHVEIDEAVWEAYAFDEEREPQIREFEARIASAPLPPWREIDLGHGFHRPRRAPASRSARRLASTSWTSSWPSITTGTTRKSSEACTKEEVPVQGHGPSHRRPPSGRRHPVLTTRRVVLSRNPPEQNQALPARQS